MEIKYLSNKLSRKKFFTFTGMGTAGFFILKTFPFNLFSKKQEDVRVTVKINTEAVSRNRIGDKNV